jgi:hypothetical protein
MLKYHFVNLDKLVWIRFAVEFLIGRLLDDLIVHFEY